MNKTNRITDFLRLLAAEICDTYFFPNEDCENCPYQKLGDVHTNPCDMDRIIQNAAYNIKGDNNA